MKRRIRGLLRRIETCFQSFWPVAGLTLLCALFFWDALWLATGRVFGGDDLTNLFLNWLGFSASSIKQGQLPLWNPYLFSGIPFVANPQVALFYPPTWLAAVMPLNRALSVIAVLHVWIAGVGMVGWLQSEGASRAGSLFAAVVFAFSGYSLVRLRGGHLGVVTTGSWLPLLLWICHRACQRRRWPLAVVGGLPAGLSLLAGHIPSFMYVALGLGAYAAFSAWEVWREKRSLWVASRPLLVGGVMLLVGLAVAAVQLLPTAQFVARSARQAAASYDFAARFSWPPGYLLTLLVPNFFGEPTHTGYWGDGIYDEFIFYIGILPLLLALLGVKLRHRLAPFLLTMGLGALLLALGRYGILHRLFYRFLPLFRVVRAPARAGYLFTLAAAALSGLSLSALQRSGRAERVRLLSPVTWPAALAVVGGALALVAADFVAFALGREANPAAGRLWHQANQVTLFLCFFLLSVGLLASWKNGKASRPYKRLWVLAVGLVVLDLWTFGNSTLGVRSVQESAYWRIVDQTVSDPETKRVLPWGLNEFEQNGGMTFGLRSVFGYDPLTLQRYEDFVTSRPDPQARTYDLLNAGYLVTTAPQEFSEGPGEPRLILEESGVFVYERPAAMPRAWIAPHTEVVDGAAALEVIHDPAFDPRTTALVEEAVSCAGDGGEVQITDYMGNRIEADTQGGGGVLVFSEIDYPGWRATVDGERAELLRADYVLRAVCVPPGRHRVVLRYAPSLLRIGVLITGVTLLCIAAAAAVWALIGGDGQDGM
ncbi:MAG: YfhO family protein [Anaerolineae bacterium]|jgi:hypothetical protein